MTEKEKQLLLKDLCARLQYKVVLRVNNRAIYRLVSILNYKNTSDWFVNGFNIDFLDIKPYLRPMSSMTEDEGKELEHLFYEIDAPCKVYTGCGCVDFAGGNDFIDAEMAEVYTDWLNAHHFDYRGLIEKGLALEAPDGMY